MHGRCDFDVRIGADSDLRLCDTIASPPEADVPGSPRDVAEVPGADLVRFSVGQECFNLEDEALPCWLVRCAGPTPTIRSGLPDPTRTVCFRLWSTTA